MVVNALLRVRHVAPEVDHFSSQAVFVVGLLAGGPGDALHPTGVGVSRGVVLVAAGVAGEIETPIVECRDLTRW